MGRETAKKLAESGFQVIAVARRLDRLNELAERIGGIVPEQGFDRFMSEKTGLTGLKV